MLSLTVYTAADDFKNFFNQLRLAPEEFWKCGMILSQLGDPRYAAEYIMTFGLRPASNIAQRFADAIVSIWRRRMLAAELVHTEALMRPMQTLLDGFTHEMGLAQLQLLSSQYSFTQTILSSWLWGIVHNLHPH